MLTARCSHLYWGQTEPCSEHWPLHRGLRWETERRGLRGQSRATEWGPSVQTPHYILDHGSQCFQKQERFFNAQEDCENFVEMNQAVDAWSLRPPVLGLASGHSHGQLSITWAPGGAQVSLGLSSHNPSHWHSPARNGSQEALVVWRTLFIV